jgi:3-methyladenine DNA glycosylase Tag
VKFDIGNSPPAYELCLRNDADYLNLLTRKIFHSGFNKNLVNDKWPAFTELFHGFDPQRVATMTNQEVLRLLTDVRIVRHRKKIAATIWNAQQFCLLAREHGSWVNWFDTLSLLPYEQRADMLIAGFKHCGPNTIFYFLLEAGEATWDDKPEQVKGPPA